MSYSKRRMMFMLVMFLSTVLFTGCKNDAITVEGFKNLGTVTINSEGANIEEQDLQINIAPETFKEDTRITINRNQDERPLGENQASEIYQITGMTEEIAQPITIRLKPNMELQGETFITIGYYTYSTSLDSYLQDYTYLETIQSDDGYLEAQFMPLTSEKSLMVKLTDWIKSEIFSITYANNTEIANPAYGPYNITITTSKQTILSENKFRIIADLDVDSKVLAECMTILEDSYAYYQNIGFDMSKFKEWPINVYIEDISTFGYFTKIPGFEAKITLDKKSINNTNELQVTVAHEFLHAVQYGYGDGNWLDEATATWAEVKYSQNSKRAPYNYENYGSANNYILNGPTQPYITGTGAKTKKSIADYTGRALNYGASILGTHQSLVSKDNMSYQEHGYAMYPIVQYLVDKHSDSVVATLHEGISNGLSPMESINSFKGMGAWSEDYYRSLITEQISAIKFTDFHGGVKTSEILKITVPDKEQLKRNEESGIITKAGTINSTLKYAYSAQVFKFDFTLPNTSNEVDNNYSLKYEFLNNANDLPMFAVILKSSKEPLKVINASNSSLNIPFKDLLYERSGKMNAYPMLVAVVNPTEEEQTITIETSIVKEAPLLSELVGIWSDGTFTFIDVVIDPEVERAVREEDVDFFESFKDDGEVGCDATILVAFKDMIGQQQAASFKIDATDDTNGSFRFLNLLGQDQKDPTPIDFTYSNGELEGIQNSDGITNTLKLTASYNETKTKVLLEGTLLCEMPVTGMTTLGSFTAELDFSKDYTESTSDSSTTGQTNP